MSVKIAPSLLSADFTRLEQEIRSVETAGADRLHLDVMDGHFVPNLTFGPFIVDAISRLTGLPLDVHLMICDPLALAPRFVKAGADILIIHSEAVKDLEASLLEIKRLGVKAGVSINPETPLAPIINVIGEADQVLIMSVHPGFGGQEFIPAALEKVRALKKLKKAGKTKAEISIDGGINRQTAKAAIEAGADILVAGSAVFGSADRAAEIKALRGSL
ncbi:MAG: ribulose-phosphate 3-epimerase [Candidatus Edwardsbacteria bacterium]|nr:ribulose-phosphate 3-epimerase [Candidatus Edwardsbacteria bacterium]